MAWQSSRKGAPKLSRRWPVTSTSGRAGSSQGKARAASAANAGRRHLGSARCSASTTVLPTTWIRSSGTRSASRFARAWAVGQKWRSVTTAVITRFASSGNGRRRSWLRSPASTCATRTPRWKEASAQTSAVVVSPWTTVQSGWKAESTRSKPAKARLASWFSAWSGRITSRSSSVSTPKKSRMPSTISRCCPVRHARTSAPRRRRSARSTGASLMASGRVPKATRMRG